jgi:hypothetical protein
MVAKWEKALLPGIVFHFLSPIDASFQTRSGTDSLNRHTAESLGRGVRQNFAKVSNLTYTLHTKGIFSVETSGIDDDLAAE